MLMLAWEMEIREEARREAREEGRKEGRDEVRISGIRNLMLHLGISAEDAMELLGIPLSERNSYITMLESAQ